MMWTESLAFTERRAKRKTIKRGKGCLDHIKLLFLERAHLCSDENVTLVILTAEGAPGKPGWQVLNSLTGLKSPWPKQLKPATLNL